jgi:LAO/AO transport system kinase
MQHHSDDPGVFIRSMSSRGKLGGLNSSIYDVAIALSLAEKDLIILETAGVGQGEVEISRCADLTAVVLVAAYGDSIQLIKAGLQEIADLFVLNKIDRYDPEQFMAELRRMSRAPEDLVARAVSAETGQGLDGLAEDLLRDCRNRSRDGDHAQSVRTNHLHSLLREHLENRVTDRLNRLPSTVTNPYRIRKRLLENDSG